MTNFDCTTCGDELDIVSMLDHDCDKILGVDNLEKSEKSTLMYIETRVVDHGGELDERQMNYEDFQNIKLFRAAGLLDLDREEEQVTEFTCWDLVSDCRRERAAREMGTGAVGL